MCKCTPNIRTPFCGKGDCVAPWQRPSTKTLEQLIVESLSSGIVYCARCGQATTQLEAVQRKFSTGFSACCDENLISVPPRHKAEPVDANQLSSWRKQ